MFLLELCYKKCAYFSLFFSIYILVVSFHVFRHAVHNFDFNPLALKFVFKKRRGGGEKDHHFLKR